MKPKTSSSIKIPERRIKYALLNKTKKLNLSNLNLTTIPSSISKLKNIESLDISNNQITEIPETIAELDNLKSLTITSNKIKSIPSHLSKLKYLEIINISGNEIENIDDIFKKIPNLKELKASHNKLRSVNISIKSNISIRSINLSDNNIETLSLNARSSEIISLNFSKNKIKKINPGFSNINSLKHLDLSENEFDEIPSPILKLKEILDLNLSKNNIAKIPRTIKNFENIYKLNISQNIIESLPIELSFLNSIEDFEVQDNLLTDFPDISRFSKIKRFDISQNIISQVPDYLCNLTTLNLLSLWGCGIRNLPQKISELTSLTYLDISRNYLTEIPRNIRKMKDLYLLDISNNYIKSIPKEITNINNIARIILYGNSDLNLPEEITGNVETSIEDFVSAKEILAYYFANIKGSRPINEMKLVVVGRGASGKTSLIKRLVFNEYDPNECETPGIEIKPWNIENSNGENIRLHTWDFGGQEILHATHQFFFSERCLYILVLTGREDQQQADAEYWLQLIGSFGGDSKVIVVLNKTSLHPFDLNRQALLEKYKNRIIEFYKIDCASEFGLPELKNAIHYQVEQSEHRKVAFPSAWFEIKEELIKNRSDFLNWDDFSYLCKEKGEGNKKNQELLAGYLHALGIALNYSKDPRLSDTHVLNPKWVTEGVYSLLRNRQRENSFSIDINDLENILDVEKYPKNKHDFLLRLMELYQLCFKLPNDNKTYLIPELLPRNQPNTTEFIENSDVGFCYIYSVLPEGLIPRFIVQTHEMSQGLERWRSGTKLLWDECIALVTSDTASKMVSIYLKGPPSQRRSFLAIIRNRFEEQHKILKGIKISEKIPLKYTDGKLLDYRDLLLREQRNELSFYPENMDTLVDVRMLLDGIESQSMREDRHLIEEKKKHNNTTNITNYNIHSNKINGSYMNNEKDNVNQTISGGTFNNSPIIAKANTFNWQQKIDLEKDSEIKTELQNLSQLIHTLCDEAPIEIGNKARKNMDILTTEALSENPDHDYLKLSAKGILDAAKTVASISTPIFETVDKITRLFQ